MKRLIGWLAEFYPNTVFFSRRFMPDLLLKLDQPHDSKGSVLFTGMCVVASRAMERKGDTLTSEFTGVTNCGAEVGDFRITIERLK